MAGGLGTRLWGPPVPAGGGTGAWAIYVKFYGTGVVTGWTTIMMLVAFGSSAQLLMTGILGEYVGRIYEEVKRRPLYIAARELNISREVGASERPGGKRSLS